MAREKECYRDMIEQLNNRFPNREFLKPQEVADFIGCSRRTVDRKYKQFYVEQFGISKVRLARLLC